MGGLKKYMPWTFRTMAVGWLAIAGVPLLSGFFSKDEILYRTFTSSVIDPTLGKILWTVGAATALMTAIYMTRLMVLTFWGDERVDRGSHHHDSHHGDHTPKESPASMVLPLAVLAAGAIFAGYLGVPEALSGGSIQNFFEHLLHPSIAQPVAHGEAAAEGHGTELALAAVSTVIAFLGIWIGWRWFRRTPLWKPPRLLEEKYFVDEAYDAAIVNPVKAASTGVLWKIVDVRIIDGAVNGAARLTSLFGAGLRYMQSGLARNYVAIVVLGAVIVIGYFMLG
jgi:NADH-quinone oxidoreductase subunit L